MTDAARAASHGSWLLWVGPLIAIAGFLSYYSFFVQWPALRDTAWLNILILVVALTLSFVGLRRTWAGGLLRRVAGVASTAFSGALLAGLVTYCYLLSYGVPDASRAAGIGTNLPAITLAAHDGSGFDLGAASTKPLILVFYRGFW
jgi:hypothetical protein